jgi:hypothetical protein
MDELKSQIQASQDAILNTVLARWDPSTGIDPAVTRAQTRRAAEHLATTADRLGRTDLVDALADGSTLDTASWWGRAVDDTYRWVGEVEP